MGVEARHGAGGLGADKRNRLRRRTVLATAGAAFLLSIQCIGYKEGRVDDEDGPPPSLDYVLANLPGTWHWDKPTGTPATTELYYTFDEAGYLEIRGSLEGAPDVVTTYEVSQKRSQWNGQPVFVIRPAEGPPWELLSLTPRKFVVRSGGIDATFVDTYWLVYRPER